MRPFLMVRHEDETGISGTGVVAEGVQFLDGTVVIRWQTHQSDHHSTVIWENLECVLAIHGHNGKTQLIFYDDLNHLQFPLDGTHMYLSTACYYGKHEDCREDCKFCKEDCVCSCHARLNVVK